jgi:DNA (cytosine-5)-methyltransferase 1
MQRAKFISLFSGAMGLDLGLEMAGFEAALCVENDPEAISTIKLNRPHLPIRGIESEEIALVAGGPPCQTFSVFGNR